MSRINASAPILVKPSNNVYTVLAGTAMLVALLALIAVCVKANELGWFNKWLSL